MNVYSGLNSWSYPKMLPVKDAMRHAKFAEYTNSEVAVYMNLFKVCQNQAFDPNTNRERLMDQWRA